MNQEPRVIDLRGVKAYLLEAHPTLPAGSQPLSKESRASSFVLIDTGFAFAWNRLRGALLDVGCRPGALSLVVITHGDGDHVGNVQRLREEYSVPIGMHQADVPRLQSTRMPKRTSPTLKGRTILALVGFMGRLLARKESSVPFAPDLLLEDGMRLDDYGLAAGVIHVPGHTPGSVAILTDDGMLFSGDTVYASARALLLIESADDYRRSVARLRALADRVTMVYPGHGKPFSGERLGQASR